MATIERIRAKLSDIELEIKELGTTIDQERQVRAQRSDKGSADSVAI